MSVKDEKKQPGEKKKCTWANIPIGVGTDKTFLKKKVGLNAGDV